MEEGLSEQMEELRQCVETMSRELQCAVCLCVLDDPHSLPCNHFYCKRCLEQVFEQRKGVCPQCRRQSHRRTVVPDPTIQNITRLFRALHAATSEPLGLDELSQGNHDWTLPVEIPHNSESSESEHTSEPIKGEANKRIHWTKMTSKERAIARKKRRRLSEMARKNASFVGSDSESDDATFENCHVCNLSGWGDLLICRMCEVRVHPACYGIMTKQEDWSCELCKTLPASQPGRKNRPKVRCFACPDSSDRAFKRTNNGRWIHASCALWIPEPVLGETVDASLIYPSRFSLNCQFCEKAGACIQCAFCTVSYHVPCARRNEIKFQLRELEDGVHFQSLCETHRDGEKTKEKKASVEIVPKTPDERPEKKSDTKSKEKTDVVKQEETRAERKPEKKSAEKKVEQQIVPVEEPRKPPEKKTAEKKVEQIVPPEDQPEKKTPPKPERKLSEKKLIKTQEKKPQVKPRTVLGNLPVNTLTQMWGVFDPKAELKLLPKPGRVPKTDMVLTSTKLPDNACLTQFAQLFNASESCPYNVLESKDGSGATHLITCARLAEHRFVPARTMKYFEAMLRRLWIMSLDWILDSIKAGTVLPESDYVVLGDPVASGGAKKCRTTDTKTLFCRLACYPAPELDVVARQNLQHLLQLGGGVWLPASPQAQRDDDRIVVMLFEHARSLDPGTLQNCNKLDAHPASTQWLYSCLSNLALMPLPPFP